MTKRLLTILLALTLCLAVALPALAVDDYPSKYRDVPKDSVTDEWRFYNRECVSFVAWCLNSRNGVPFSNYENGLWWGNANTWDDTARALGYTVNGTPAVGAVAYWDNGYYGHVAWVSAVNGGYVTVEEYNYDYDGGYHERTIPASEPYGYIHIKDLSSWGGGSVSEPAEPTVTFSDLEEYLYTFVDETEAVVGQRITVSDGDCSEIGFCLYDAKGGCVAAAFTACVGSRFFFSVNEDCGYELTPGTDYTYKFYAIVDGKTYWSEEGSFRTKGEAPAEPVLNFPVYGHGEIHYATVREYVPGQFEDVNDGDWFQNSVASAYKMGLIVGMSSNTFGPSGQVTVAQAITMACRLHSIFHTGKEDIPAVDGPWYQKYLDYAYENDIIDWDYYYSDVDKPATRAQFAEIFVAALPEEALWMRNLIDDGAVPDVDPEADYADAVYTLYRVGILAGSDAVGTFRPDSNIKRSEAAAILCRMADSDNRLTVRL